MPWTKSPEFLSLTEQEREAFLELARTNMNNAVLARYSGIAVDTVAKLRNMRRTERERGHMRVARAVIAAPSPPRSGCRLLDALRATHPRGEGEPTRDTIHAWAMARLRGRCARLSSGGQTHDRD